jgi:GNAT superfamily N-acetyltransferase
LNISIRKAEPADAKAVSDLMIRQSRKYILPTCGASAHDLLLASMSEASIVDYLTRGYAYHVAQAENGGILGVIGVRDNAHLYHLFVADDYRGRGVSRRLWETAKAECVAKGNAGCFTVNSAVNAENVYLSFGFRRKGGIRIREGMVDIPMVLQVSG